ncbi:MAG: Uncharacterised protein [Porticoccaceae bacterium UBA1117]|jgi:prepilin-type N-terminal cleavage/methylation domain-containing protein|nr:MAG: Uncharacterised protein [Porticoccaceae bacterium UBA1117]
MVIQAKGYTLIELLVSMSLLSFIILIGSSSFAIFSDRWDGQLGKFDASMANARNLMLVNDALASLVPYVALSRDKKPRMYFEGNRNGFVAVSSDSVAVSGRFAVVRLSVLQRDDLTFDLLYEEWPMVDNVLIDTFQKIPFYKPLVLFKGITKPTFQYLGWTDPGARYGEGESLLDNPMEWLAEYNALDMMEIPVKVKLTFSTDSGPIILISDIADPVPGLLIRYDEEPVF